MIKEIWKDIKGYEGLYQVSNYGKVKSLIQNNSRRKKVLKPYLNNSGYLRVNLYDKLGKAKKLYIHRLVALNFLDKPNNKNIVNHIDCNKLNNCVENLEWCDQKFNIYETIKNNLQQKVNMVKIRNLKTNEIKIFPTMQDASLFMFKHKRKLSRLKEYYGSHFNYDNWEIKVGDE